MPQPDTLPWSHNSPRLALIFTELACDVNIVELILCVTEVVALDAATLFTILIELQRTGKDLLLLCRNLHGTVLGSDSESQEKSHAKWTACVPVRCSALRTAVHVIGRGLHQRLYARFAFVSPDTAGVLPRSGICHWPLDRRPACVSREPLSTDSSSTAWHRVCAKLSTGVSRCDDVNWIAWHGSVTTISWRSTQSPAVWSLVRSRPVSLKLIVRTRILVRVARTCGGVCANLLVRHSVCDT